VVHMLDGRIRSEALKNQSAPLSRRPAPLP
jgi:hypothetical protein